MEFEANPEQRALEDEARRFAAEVLEPRAAELDRVGGFPSESLAAAAAAGWLGINVPRRYGGREAGSVAYALAIMQFARACAATTVAMCVSNMVAEVVLAFGDEAQRERWIPALCDGRAVVGAFALSEAGAGSDPASMSTQAIALEGGRWCLRGAKLWITSGSDAGLFVVWARTAPGTGARGISCFLVPGDAVGLERGRPEAKMGLHGSTTTPIVFEDAELGPEALLHRPGDGFRVAMMALDGGRIGIAAQAIGIARAALGDALEASAGDPEAAAILANGATELTAAELLTLRAAWLKEQGQPFSREAAMAKLFATETAVATCDRLLELVGAAGWSDAGRAQRCFRDVRVTTIYEGTSEIQRLVLARELMRRWKGAS